MNREDSPGALTWVHNGLDSIILGLAANTVGIAAASTLVDRLHLQSPATNAAAGTLTALALVPLNYGISALTRKLSEYSPIEKAIAYALASSVAGACFSLYLGVKDLMLPPSSPQKTQITATRALTETEGKLGLQEIYVKYKDTIDLASETYKVPVSLIVANIYAESRGDPRAVSCTGAAGLMQLVVDTAKDVDVTTTNYELVKDPKFKCEHKTWPSTRKGCNAVDNSECDYTHDERFDPVKNITGGTRNLRIKWNVRRNWRDTLTDNAGGDTTYPATVWRYKEEFERLQRKE